MGTWQSNLPPLLPSNAMPRRAFFLISLLFPLSLSATAQWSTENLSETRTGLAAASVGDWVLFAGGVRNASPISITYLDLVDLQHAPSGVWTQAKLAQPRSSLAAAVLRGKAYFAGGDEAGTPSALVDIFDASSASWSTDLLSQARTFLAGVSVGHLVLFAGGTTGAAESDVVDILDVVTGIWSTAQLSSPRAALAATSVGSLAIFAGGFASNAPSDVVDIYDSQTGQWTTTTLSQARGRLAATTAGDFALFAGGFGTSGTSNRVDVFDATSGSWSTAALAGARHSLAATTVGDVALFAGGTFQFSQMSSRVDLFDAATGSWTTTNLGQARTGLVATTSRHEALFGGGLIGCFSHCISSSLVDRFENQEGTNYCGPAVANSAGAPARIWAGGSGVAGEALTLVARQLPTDRFGFFLASANQGFVQPPGSQGFICLGGSIARYGSPKQVRNSGPAGRFELEIDTGSIPLSPPASVMPGETWNFQAWFRDKNPGSTSNFTDAVAVTFQ